MPNILSATPLGFFASSSFIARIQQSAITIASGATSNTATITSVNTANAMLIYQGLTATSTSNVQSVATRIELTNATTVTATRGSSNSDAVTVNFTVVEFTSNVNSIQAGTIGISTIQTSNTAIISAVGANAFILWLGASSATSMTSLSRVSTSVVLTNSTTVTANIGLATSAMTVGYMVVDLSSTLVNSVQKLAHTDATAATSYTDTITSVNTNNAIILNNGDILTVGSGPSVFLHEKVLTDSTTVTYTRSSNATSASRTTYGTVVEFKAAVLNGAVQRGTLALSSQTTNTATITSVNTSKSFISQSGFLTSGTNPNVSQVNLALTNATTITSNMNSSGSATNSYAVVSFN